MATMKAARIHEPGGAFRIDTIAKPAARAHDVVVAVRAAGVIPNLRNVMDNYGDRGYLTVPELPAIYGLDAAGVIEEVGDNVAGFAKGDRVYINPGRSCGSCHACRHGEPTNCSSYTFQGYFGFTPASTEVYRNYPYGGFSQFVTAPAYSLVKLPEVVSFDQAARFGYLGTAYAGLQKAGVGPGRTVLVNGGTGTLGLGAVLLARAMGASRIFVLARNRDLLARVQAIDPERIRTLSAGAQPVGEWVHAETGGVGADAVLDTLGPGAPASVMQQSITALRRGGRLVDVGGMHEPLSVNMHELMCSQISIETSLWFTAGQGQDMAAMAEAGTLDLSHFEHKVFPLEKSGDALALAEKRSGGFVNVVIHP